LASLAACRPRRSYQPRWLFLGHTCFVSVSGALRHEQGGGKKTVTKTKTKEREGEIREATCNLYGPGASGSIMSMSTREGVGVKTIPY